MSILFGGGRGLSQTNWTSMSILFGGGLPQTNWSSMSILFGGGLPQTNWTSMSILLGGGGAPPKQIGRPCPFRLGRGAPPNIIRI